MPKRIHDDTEVGTSSPPLKTLKSAATCDFCAKTFTSRGISRHLSSCSQKKRHDAAEAKKPRTYNFTIVNATIFEIILSFVGNQTLTKMQMITGEKYPQCEPELASICCKCENDNPVILHGLCTECESQLDSYMSCTIKDVAKNKYGVKDVDFRLIPCEVRKRYTLFDRITLEKFMIRTCGSKRDWVRYLVKKNTRKNRLNATLQRKEEETDAFLEELAPGFAHYVRAIGFKKTDTELLQHAVDALWW